MLRDLAFIGKGLQRGFLRAAAYDTVYGVRKPAYDIRQAADYKFMPFALDKTGCL